MVDQNAYAKVVTELADRKLGDPKAQAGLQTQVASAYLALGEVAKANEAIQAALVAVPGDARALRFRLAPPPSKRSSAGVEADRFGHRGGSNNAQALVVKADSRTRRAGVGKGQTLERAVEVSGGSLGARYALASMLVESGQLDKAAAQVDAMKKMSPLEFRTLYADALISYSRGDVAHARDTIQKVLSVNPDNLQSIYLAGLIDMKLGSYASAEDRCAGGRARIRRLEPDARARRPVHAHRTERPSHRNARSSANPRA
jgi:tetratricopeptide (TPR) repeat protein